MDGPDTARALESDKRSPTRPRAMLPARWHAVSVVAKPTGCDEAKAIRSKRFLSNEAPRLPLTACTMSGHCACTYKHHTDRRGASRRDDAGLRKPRAGQSERRASRGRRHSDI